MKFKISILVVALISVGFAFWWKQQDHHSDRNIPQPTSQKNTKKTAHVISPPTAKIPAPKIIGMAVSNAPVTARLVIDRTQPFSKRYAKTRGLNKKLQPTVVRALTNYLLQNDERDHTDRDYALKNELMDGLCTQDVLSPDLVGVLSSLYRDSGQDVVIRDYAVQHLISVYDRLAEPLPLSAGQITGQRSQIRDVLWESLSESDSSIAGTALLGLFRLAQTQPGFDQGKIAQAALELAEDEQASELTRVTALQVCAQMQIKESLPLLAKTAVQPNDMSLRLSAIAALGGLGGKNELEMLRRIARENNPRLQPALVLAQQLVQQRIGEQ